MATESCPGRVCVTVCEGKCSKGGVQCVGEDVHEGGGGEGCVLCAVKVICIEVCVSCVCV